MPYAYYYSPSVYQPPEFYEEPTTSVLTGTFLHKCFYDLLEMIPSSPSRLLWKAPSTPLDGFVVVGPRYEHQESSTITKSIHRRVSKGIVSSPTGFV